MQEAIGASQGVNGQKDPERGLNPGVNDLMHDGSHLKEDELGLKKEDRGLKKEDLGLKDQGKRPEAKGIGRQASNGG